MSRPVEPFHVPPHPRPPEKKCGADIHYIYEGPQPDSQIPPKPRPVPRPR